MSNKPISTFQIKDGKILVNTPYSEKVASDCRRMGGKWNGSEWELPESRKEEVEEELGSSSTLVEVDIPYSHKELTDDAQMTIGWHVLASRRGRDSRVNLYADLIAGTVPSRGGSVKHPSVSASNDSIFRCFVPRDFAERHELKIVGEGKVDREALIKEKEELEGRLKEIEELLGGAE